MDALCINQADVGERGHQVRQMRAIYANVELVYAYVGEGSEMGNAFLAAISTYRLGDSLQDDQLLRTEQISESCLDEFFERRWFSRVWCLQEIGMARYVELIYGGITIPWSQIVMANLQQYQRQSIPKLRQYLRQSIRHSLKYTGNFPLVLRLPVGIRQPIKKLYSLLEAARLSCAASDPRDMYMLCSDCLKARTL
jgi:hypothetical protein